jgi:hypothetical protein
MNISEKLEKLGITSEDQKAIETAITDLISESVDSKEVALKEKYELISEEYVTEQISEKEEKLKESLNEENDEWRKELESSLIDKFDQFLDSEIDGKISDSLLEDTAYLEIAKPIVESIKKIYEDNHVSLDSEGAKVIAEAKEEVVSLKEQLSESINKTMEAEKLAETGAIKLRISEAVDGLSEEDSAKVKTLFEDKSFDEINAKIDNYVSILAEEVLKEENEDGKEELDETVVLDTDDNGVEDEKVITESVIPMNTLAERYI